MSSKVKIGSASRSSTDLSYFNREVKHRAQPPARGGRASAARRDRRWASRSSQLRRWRQPSGSATGTGAVLAALVDGRAYTDDGGAGALLCDIADKTVLSQALSKQAVPFLSTPGDFARLPPGAPCHAPLPWPPRGTGFRASSPGPPPPPRPPGAKKARLGA